MASEETTDTPASGFDRDKTFIEAMGQMVIGSIIAGAVIIVPVVFIYVVYLVGTVLPPESKEAADPTPDSFSAYEYRYEHPAGSGMHPLQTSAWS